MLEYQRDIPADSPPDAITATSEHVRDQLAAIADADDDPTTLAADVVVRIERHPENSALLRIRGVLDAEPDAPYLKDDFDPFEGVDPALVEEVLGGPH